MPTDIGKTGAKPGTTGIGARTGAAPRRGDRQLSDAPVDDTVSLTPSALAVQKAYDALATTPTVRTELVAEIRIAIADGRYEVDAARIADKMIGFEHAVVVAGSARPVAAGSAGIA